MDSYRITLELTPADADIRTVKQHLIAFNNQYAEPEHYQSLTLFVRDDSEGVVGGLDDSLLVIPSIFFRSDSSPC